MDDMVVQGFRALELPPGATIDAIGKAFNDLSRVWDSDRLAGQPDLQQKAWEKQREMKWAYETLVRHASQTAAAEQQSAIGHREESHHGNAVPLPILATADYAGFWIRAVAMIIDTIIMWVPESVLRWLAPDLGVSGMSLEIIDFFYLTVVWTIYYGFMESSRFQATLGKQVLGLKVVDYEGRRISFNRAVGRSLAIDISLLSQGIGIFMIVWTKKKQGIYDMLAKCLVVRRVA